MYHQKDMLLDKDKNAKFHTTCTLLIGSKTGLDYVLKFFQGITWDEIMDNIEKDANLRNSSAITKEDWIRFYQMKAQDSAQVL